MNFKTEQIASITNARILNDGLFTSTINHLSYDSRKISHPTSTLFFAFIGHDQDGHHFIANAYHQGVRNFVVTSPVEIEDYPKANFFQVEDVLKSLQMIAATHRQTLKTEILAITGSNGKTIVKEWLGQLLGSTVYKSPLSYNSQLGVAISISNILKKSKLAIIEAGISKKDEMAVLEKIIQPKHLLFTNLGTAHDEGFDNAEEKLKEKLLLGKNAKYIFCSSNQAEVFSNIKKQFPGKKIISWGRSSSDHLKIVEESIQAHSTIIKLEANGKTIDIAIPFVDQISIENALHALNFALFQSVDHEAIKSRSTKLPTIRLRLEILEGINNCKIINDAYVSDLYALQRAINFQQVHKEDKSLTLILSSIHQGRKSKIDLASEVAKQLNQSNIERVILIGKSDLVLSKFLKPEIEFIKIDSTASLSKLHFSNECILIKGSRNSNLESSLEYLEKRAYTSRLEINLSAIADNFNYYKSRLSSRTGIMAVLKAGAYGSGSLPVARMLVDKNVDYILVAHIDEGIELRNNGISTPIVVLNPDPHSLYKLFEFNLETELYSLKILDKIDRLSRHYQSSIQLHINIDTGMHRLGLQSNDIPMLISKLAQNEYLQVETIFSHLAGSESKSHDDFSHQQFRRFIKHAEQIELELEIKSKKHILNSAGILRFPDYHLDLVRLGLGLYGIDSSGNFEKEIRKVHTLVAHVLQIKQVSKGETIGYNQTYQAETDLSIAILNIGYADGLSRRLSNGNWQVKIQGQLVPIIGQISMDLTTVDITTIKHVDVGEEVVIFDETQRIEAMSNQASTIPYEILTNISSRVKRVYFTE